MSCSFIAAYDSAYDRLSLKNAALVYFSRTFSQKRNECIMTQCAECVKDACIMYRSRPMCLLHFNMSKGILQESGEPEVIDATLLASQNMTVRGLWDEAITNVVVRMLEMQQEEQRDPLSVLDTSSVSVPEISTSYRIPKRPRAAQEKAMSHSLSSALPLDVPCEKCGSIATHIVDTSAMQNESRSEKWGYRENPAPMLRISCDDCGHVLMKLQ